MLRSFINVAPTFGEHESAKQLRKILPMWDAMLGSGKSAQVLYDLATFPGQTPRVLIPSKRSSLQMSAADVTGYCAALAKVERILTPDDQILALRVLQNAPVTRLEQTVLEEGAVELVEGFGEMGIPCTPEDVVMRGPLVMLRPLCVWR